MEPTHTSPTGSGISVEREITVHTDDNKNEDPDTGYAESVVSTAYSMSDPKGGETRAPEPRGEDIPAVRKLPRTEVSTDCQRDLAALFRGNPPPGNLMSLPDDSSSSADRKWDRFKVFRKRQKRRKQRPPTIKLPDSAISARTTGGYRHIAISIPLEYSQLGKISSQYPVFKPTKEELCRAPGSRPGLVRMRTPDRSITFLKSVAEDRETLPSMSMSRGKSALLERRARLAAPPQRKSEEEQQIHRYNTRRNSAHLVSKRPPGPITISYTQQEPLLPSPGFAEQQSDIQKGIAGYRDLGAEITPRKIEIPLIQQTEGSSKQKQPERAGNEGTDIGISSAKGPPVSSIPLAYPPPTLMLPERTSSKKSKTTTAGPVESPAVESLAVESPANEISTGPRGSFAESLMTESSPKILKAETATAYHNIPVVVRPSSQKQEAESPLNLNVPPLPSLSADRSVQTEPLPGLSHVVEKSSRRRKERDRESEQKKVNKLVAQLRETQLSASHLLEKGATGQSAWPDSPVLGRFHRDLSTPLRPIPSPTAKEGADIAPTYAKPGPGLQMPRLLPTAIPRTQEWSPSASSPSISPSLSSTESPSDGSSRLRRLRLKEKQAEREERETRERFSAEVLAQQRETSDRLVRQEELLRRYERLKGQHVHDLERRLRRLERNGDVMMRSMVPLMESLNRLLQDQHSLRRDSLGVSQQQEQQLYLRPQGFSERRAYSLGSAGGRDVPPLDTSRAQPVQGDLRLHRHRPGDLRIPERSARRPAPTTGPLQEECESEPGMRRRNEEMDTHPQHSA
ncbi:hypothetical protein F4779DRAFT_634385 [Xylariaceae sp. FL0662B]|nr:hypothetical protein F4779DRAFT_634385 [Xylariaceae sp. FL0662B]